LPRRLTTSSVPAELAAAGASCEVLTPSAESPDLTGRRAAACAPSGAGADTLALSTTALVARGLEARAASRAGAVASTLSVVPVALAVRVTALAAAGGAGSAVFLACAGLCAETRAPPSAGSGSTPPGGTSKARSICCPLRTTTTTLPTFVRPAKGIVLADTVLAVPSASTNHSLSAAATRKAETICPLLADSLAATPCVPRPLAGNSASGERRANPAALTSTSAPSAFSAGITAPPTTRSPLCSLMPAIPPAGKPIGRTSSSAKRITCPRAVASMISPPPLPNPVHTSSSLSSSFITVGFACAAAERSARLMRLIAPSAVARTNWPSSGSPLGLRAVKAAAMRSVRWSPPRSAW